MGLLANVKSHAHKNFIDYEEYPETVDLQNRSVAMIAKLFIPPSSLETTLREFRSTIGSSEAIILAVLAVKKKWKLARKAAGLSTENRDENTIGVVAILGTTYTGQYEDAAEIARLLDEKHKKTGLDVNIHVDAASGGFVAPFVNPDLIWDFRISGRRAVYGKSGFRSIMSNIQNTSDFIAEELVKTGRFTIMSEGEGKGLPLIAFELHYDELAIASQLRQRNWVYRSRLHLAPNAKNVRLIRVVCRADMSRGRAELLLRYLEDACKQLDIMSKNTIDEISHHAIALRKQKHHDRGSVRHHKAGHGEEGQPRGDGTAPSMGDKTHAGDLLRTEKIPSKG
ncbi:pyridoxal phosphate-dependent transferase [Mrakia frigida]|uniref:pyridoxal phosphate-dependent transferase n=1 Tax=Mrakia frigida TaxID=29902 RepID=UPI003FCC13E7